MYQLLNTSDLVITIQNNSENDVTIKGNDAIMLPNIYKHLIK